MRNAAGFTFLPRDGLCSGQAHRPAFKGEEDFTAAGGRVVHPQFWTKEASGSDGAGAADPIGRTTCMDSRNRNGTHGRSWVRVGGSSLARGTSTVQHARPE